MIEHSQACLELILACKILVNQKLDSGPFGNVSIRIPNREEFLINPHGITFDQLTTKDIVRVAFDGTILQGTASAHPGECIHREIYRLRKDIGAIVHTHSENTVALSLLGCTIEPYTQLGIAFSADQGFYEGFTGPVRSSNEAEAIAQALGTHSIVIAKNHGLFAAAPTIQSALWDMVLADNAAGVHLSAHQLGILQADKPSAAVIQKSRLEVRNKQSTLMWRSYLNALHDTDALIASTIV